MFSFPLGFSGMHNQLAVVYSDAWNEQSHNTQIISISRVCNTRSNIDNIDGKHKCVVKMKSNKLFCKLEMARFRVGVLRVFDLYNIIYYYTYVVRYHVWKMFEIMCKSTLLIFAKIVIYHIYTPSI